MGVREELVPSSCLEGLTAREIGPRMGISHVSVVKIRNKIRRRYAGLDGTVQPVVKMGNTQPERRPSLQAWLPPGLSPDLYVYNTMMC